jgi:RHS repeat-associated protein
LVGEYDGAGHLIEETVWLGDIPVATLRPDPAGGVDIYYVHSDHLNTPRRVTRPSDNAVVWAWTSDPFGNGFVDQNPDGDGQYFVYNLRFPGQYYDVETGLNYNYRRDYDPATGRYLESDPIGLHGGSYSTYAYALGNPLSNIDPLGLASCWFFDCPSLPEPLYNGLVGTLDSLSLGIGPLLRREYGIAGPDTCSRSYHAGQAAGIIGGIVTGESEAEAVVLTVEQAANLARFANKLPAATGEIAVDTLGEDSLIFSSTVPGNVPGSYAVYQKIVDALGITTDYVKTTVDNLGNLVSVKVKF